MKCGLGFFQGPTNKAHHLRPSGIHPSSSWYWHFLKERLLLKSGHDFLIFCNKYVQSGGTTVLQRVIWARVTLFLYNAVSYLRAPRQPPLGQVPLTDTSGHAKLHAAPCHPQTWQANISFCTAFLKKEINTKTEFPPPRIQHFLANHKFWQNLLYITVIQLVPLSSNQHILPCKLSISVWVYVWQRRESLKTNKANLNNTCSATTVSKLKCGTILKKEKNVWQNVSIETLEPFLHSRYPSRHWDVKKNNTFCLSGVYNWKACCRGRWMGRQGFPSQMHTSWATAQWILTKHTPRDVGKGWWSEQRTWLLPRHAEKLG